MFEEQQDRRPVWLEQCERGGTWMEMSEVMGADCVASPGPCGDLILYPE